MKQLWPLLILILFAGILSAEEPAPQPQADLKAHAIIYPADLPQDYVRDLPAPSRSQQEYMEVSAPDYPGLRIELEPLNKQLTFSKRVGGYATHDPKYYGQGGMILAYWGFPMVSGEVVSVPTVKK